MLAIIILLLLPEIIECEFIEHRPQVKLIIFFLEITNFLK